MTLKALALGSTFIANLLILHCSTPLEYLLKLYMVALMVAR